MSEPIYVLASDIHGCHLTLQALLVKVTEHLAGEPYKVILLGDLIDRGPHSREVVDWTMRNRIQCCLGNHEHLAIDYCLNQLKGDKSEYDDGIWLMNGGIKCLESFTKKSFSEKSCLPRAVTAWMRQMPLHIIPHEYPDLLLSHTGHGLITKDSQHTPFDAVWARSTGFPKDGYTRHLIPARQIQMTSCWYAIADACGNIYPGSFAKDHRGAEFAHYIHGLATTPYSIYVEKEPPYLIRRDLWKPYADRGDHVVHCRIETQENIKITIESI